MDGSEETGIERPSRVRSWRDRIGERLSDLAAGVRKTANADVALQASMASLIELSAARYPLDPGARWSAGEPLRLLFAGYSGTRNTGADVRVEEMIRQVRHLLDERCELFITTIDPKLSRGYFRTVTQLHLPQIFPRFVFDTVHEMHGVIACEGSMFKSKFASALSTFMVGALGMAAAENKIAVGYGGEAGAMDETLKTLVRRYCQSALVLCRNVESQRVLQDLGVPAKGGTDTAWTFEPAPAEVGEALLRSVGWAGERLLIVCPINPFWWPVKPDLGKGLTWALTGEHDDAHYASVYFHREGPEVDRAQARYLDALASAVRAHRRKHPCFVAVVGMEALDRRACEGLSERLGGAPCLVSDDHDMYTLVSALRRANTLLASRYHAIVCSMPGLVPSMGVTMDERIRNLMADRGTPELCLEVDDPDLANKVEQGLSRLHSDAEALTDGIGRCVVNNLVRMGGMGMDLVDHLRERHPDLPLRKEFGRHGDPWEHLPPLSAAAEALALRHASG